MQIEMQRKANELSDLTIGSAIEVYRHLGPGLLESIYEQCLHSRAEISEKV